MSSKQASKQTNSKMSKNSHIDFMTKMFPVFIIFLVIKKKYSIIIINNILLSIIFFLNVEYTQFYS